jgi:L-ascorbate metabolism protein UlaG (beta-lactamase superfamily)
MVKSAGILIRTLFWAFLLTLLFALISAAGAKGRVADQGKAHHSDNGFRNLYPVKGPGFLDFLKWRWDRLWMDIPSGDSYHFPLAKNDPDELARNGTRPSITWIGHATVLVQINGKNILTDPHFSLRASPVQWAGPKRVVEPGIPLKELPVIHAVLISHDHYDSLDYHSIQALAQRNGGENTQFFVGLGMGGWLRDWGARKVVEMDWHETREIDGLEVIATPCRHWSKRALSGRNQTLWAGWIVKSEDFSFFFAGDSGYSPIFREIGVRYGPFDLAAIPIGAYEPRWFMKWNHMTPEEAVEVHEDVRAARSVAIHWGTFMLTDEPLDEPPRRLSIALERAKIPSDQFVVLRHGETVYLD